MRQEFRIQGGNEWDVLEERHTNPKRERGRTAHGQECPCYEACGAWLSNRGTDIPVRANGRASSDETGSHASAHSPSLTLRVSMRIRSPGEHVGSRSEPGTESVCRALAISHRHREAQAARFSTLVNRQPDREDEFGTSSNSDNLTRTFRSRQGSTLAEAMSLQRAKTSS